MSELRYKQDTQNIIYQQLKRVGGGERENWTLSDALMVFYWR